MSAVLLGPVEAFPGAAPDKAQALKPLEEAAEAYAAWQSWRAWLDSGLDAPGGAPLTALLDEVADCVQACCNLAASLGCSDLRPYMARCEGRNRERGRL